MRLLPVNIGRICFCKHRILLIQCHMTSLVIRIFKCIYFIVFMFELFRANDVIYWTVPFNIAKFPGGRAFSDRKHSFQLQAYTIRVNMYRVRRRLKTHSNDFAWLVIVFPSAIRKRTRKSFKKNVI